MEKYQRDICCRIADFYCSQDDGKRKQTYQAIQELSELICVLSKRDDQRDKTYKLSLLDEICDVEIMVEQLKHMNEISDADVKNYTGEKLHRQLRRIGELKNTSNLSVRSCADCIHNSVCKNNIPCIDYEFAAAKGRF